VVARDDPDQRREAGAAHRRPVPAPPRRGDHTPAAVDERDALVTEIDQVRQRLPYPGVVAGTHHVDAGVVHPPADHDHRHLRGQPS
jgi:hypothetical protein